jgi:hypothetical protein
MQQTQTDSFPKPIPRERRRQRIVPNMKFECPRRPV